MKKFFLSGYVSENSLRVFRKTFTKFIPFLISLLLTACNFTDWGEFGSREKWWQYTRIGSDFADNLVGISTVIVIALIILIALYGSVLFFLFCREDWKVLRFSIPLVIGGIGFALIRGMLQHLAWWIVRWEESNFIRDFLFGTIWFTIAGGIYGVFIGSVVSAAIILASYPLLFPIRWLLKKFNRKIELNHKA